MVRGPGDRDRTSRCRAARAFAIADNRLTENSTWDDRLLADQLKGLSILDLSFDLEATGFEMGEIDFRIRPASATIVRC